MGRVCVGHPPHPTLHIMLLMDLSAIPGRPWVADAECQGMNPDIFFPGNDPEIKTGTQHYEAVRAAKSVCDRCEVRKTCLDWALHNKIPYGIFGGKTPRERRSILRKRKKKDAS